MSLAQLQPQLVFSILVEEETRGDSLQRTKIAYFVNRRHSKDLTVLIQHTTYF